jgi:hypothetical protein
VSSTTVATLTRKELAAAIGVCVITIARHERDWGLDRCKAVCPAKPISFFRKAANRTLIKARVICEPI